MKGDITPSFNTTTTTKEIQGLYTGTRGLRETDAVTSLHHRVTDTAHAHTPAREHATTLPEDRKSPTKSAREGERP